MRFQLSLAQVRTDKISCRALSLRANLRRARRVERHFVDIAVAVFGDALDLRNGIGPIEFHRQDGAAISGDYRLAVQPAAQHREKRNIRVRRSGPR